MSLPTIPRLAASVLPLALLCACAATRPLDPGWLATLSAQPPTALLLLGEQHDAPEHQQWERATVQWLAQRGQLAALVIEMAEAGASTEGASAHRATWPIAYTIGGVRDWLFAQSKAG